MTEQPDQDQPDSVNLTPTEAQEEADAAQAEEARRIRHDHDDAEADEWGDESFPASDPPSNY